MALANGFVIDRAQNAGITSAGVGQERIFEDGNPLAVGILRDTPDLTYELESWDLTTDIEALLLGLTPSSVTTGQVLDFNDAIPMDVHAPFRNKSTGTTVAGSLIIPSLTLETAAYRFGVKQNGGETFTLRGDAEYFVPGSAFRESFAKSGAGPYSLAHTAIEYDESGATIFVLGLCWIDTDGTYQRLYHTLDYTDTSGTFTLTTAAAAAMPGTATLHAMYGSTTATTISATATSSAAVKPAAVKSQHIDVYVSDGNPTPTLLRWDGVQTAEATRRVTLQNDSELGNPHYIGQDYDIPDVTGTIGVRPKDVANLFAKIAQATGVAANKIVGLLADTPLEMEIRISHPDTGVRIKTLYVPDAIFTPPTAPARANSNVDFSFAYQSEQGRLQVIKGARV